ncbi:MAG TPA: helix-turn-helix domain-containing protein [bacterium]|nr:helix-turn-helix domain-containing protein [bacterium]
MKKRYACAHAVLPADLVEAVQAHFTGLLWVPSSKLFYDERKKLVLALKEEGVPIKEIARLAGISPRRVHQIIKNERPDKIISGTFDDSPVCNQVEGVSDKGSEIQLNLLPAPESDASVQNSHDDD